MAQELADHGFSEEEQRDASRRVLEDAINERGKDVFNDPTLATAARDFVAPTAEKKQILEQEVDRIVEEIAEERGISRGEAAQILMMQARKFIEDKTSQQEEQ